MWAICSPNDTGDSNVFTDFLKNNTTSITIWCGALCTFAIYSVLYTENKFYRFFEHIFIGLGTGYGVYFIWSEVLGPKWWEPMVAGGQWYWAFAAVLGSMFYFMYSKKHAWISRVIFGLFMGLAAGGMFREFYEIYFPQMGASMKPLAGKGIPACQVANTIVFYIILFASMSYFFFSFEHKNVALSKSAAAGRWFLMIGFGAIFGATVMGRMTLFIGRFNFLLNEWAPEVKRNWSQSWFQITIGIVVLLVIVWAWRSRRRGTSGTQS